MRSVHQPLRKVNVRAVTDENRSHLNMCSLCGVHTKKRNISLSTNGGITETERRRIGCVILRIGACDEWTLWTSCLMVHDDTCSQLTYVLLQNANELSTICVKKTYLKHGTRDIFSEDSTEPLGVGTSSRECLAEFC